MCVKDNYKGRLCNDAKTDCNIFALEHYPSEISVFGSNGYIYTKVAEDALEDVKRLNARYSLISFPSSTQTFSAKRLIK